MIEKRNKIEHSLLLMCAAAVSLLLYSSVSLYRVCLDFSSASSVQDANTQSESKERERAGKKNTALHLLSY